MNKAILILQPNVTKYKYEIVAKLANDGFKITQQLCTKLSPEQARDLYKTKNEELLSFFTSGPILVYEVQKPNIMDHVEEVVGHEEAMLAKKTSLRAIYAKEKNGFYITDDIACIQFFFPDTIITPLPTPESAKSFLKEAVYPTLLDGLTLLCKEKPANPTEWLGKWLIECDPRKPRIIEPE